MGLDNLPGLNPCLPAGTAIRDEAGRIDCTATQNAGGCPWLNAPDRPAEGALVGMLGTDCWYRGKWGNEILAALGITDDSFYGNDDDGIRKYPAECLDLADRLDAAIPGFTGWTAEMPKTDAVYAAWYLRWAATHCDGLIAWY